MNAKLSFNQCFSLVYFLYIFFTFSCVFANINDIMKKENFQNQDTELVIYKKTEKGLDVYTFTPKNQLDKELMDAIENRLKVNNDGVVSFSADEKNLVTLSIDSAVISEEELKHTFNVVCQTFSYLSNDYKIIRL